MQIESASLLNGNNRSVQGGVFWWITLRLHAQNEHAQMQNNHPPALGKNVPGCLRDTGSPEGANRFRQVRSRA